MQQNTVAQIQRDLVALNQTITEALDYNYLSDKTYTKIITMIGHIDHECTKHHDSLEEVTYSSKVKKRLDNICHILLAIQKQAKIPNNENLMHPSGDYFNEDNSLFLTPETKHSLEKILEEK